MIDPKCPKCNSTKVRSFDNEPLFHPKFNQPLTDEDMRYDNLAYVHFSCDDCEETFWKTFYFVEKET